MMDHMSGNWKTENKKNAWTIEEDELLKLKVDEYGTRDWKKISQNTGRSSKQCRERWCHQLNSKLNKGIWNNKEDEIILDAQMKIGNKWSKIASLVNRAPIDVKNRFNKIQRNNVRLQSLKRLIESNERIFHSSSNYFSPSISQSTSYVSSPREQVSCICTDNSHQLEMHQIGTYSMILPDSKDESNFFFTPAQNELVYNFDTIRSDSCYRFESFCSGITDGLDTSNSLEHIDTSFPLALSQLYETEDSHSLVDHHVIESVPDTFYNSFGDE